MIPFYLTDLSILLSYRVRTGHEKPGKTWNFRILFSRPWKSWNLIVGPWMSWKINILYGSLVTADDKATTMEDLDE